MIILFPVEVVNRELASKVVLATELANRGVSSLVGNDAEVNKVAHRMQGNAVWFRISVGGKQKRAEVEKLAKQGIRIVAQDEEAGITFENFSQFFGLRSLDHVELLDRFFTWSLREQSSIVSSFPNTADRIVPTGGLRTALWGSAGRIFYKNDAAEIKNNYGAFVLVSTNFGRANPTMGFEKKLARVRKDKRDRYPDPEDYIAGARHQERLISEFTRAVKGITEKTSLSVVLRPGVGENESFWRRKFAQNSRVTVCRDKAVTPWLLASEYLVQNSSAVGVEAVCLGVPTIQLSSDVSFTDPMPLLQNIGLRITDGDEVAGHILEDSVLTAATESSGRWWRTELLDAPESLSSIGKVATELAGLLADTRNGTVAKYRFLLSATWVRSITDFARVLAHRVSENPSWVKKNGLSPRRIRHTVENACRVMNVRRPRVKRVGFRTFLFQPPV